MSHAMRHDLRDACSRASTAPVGRRDLLASLARLAGGVFASSLCAGRPLLAGARAHWMPSQFDGCQDEHHAAFLESRAGYFPTVWPSEHTDLWRSHAVFDAGLPSDLAHRELDVTTASLELPVWGYTRAENQVFVIGGSPFLLEFFTKAIENGANSPALDLASELQRAAQFVPYVAQVDTRTMSVRRVEMRLGQTLNYTGGLLMHQNGFVYAVAQSVLYKIDPSTMTAVKALPLPLVGTSSAQHFLTTYNGMQVLADGQLVLKGFPFFDSTMMLPGQLLLIDPDDLRINVQNSPVVSSARLTIQQSCKGPTYLYTVDATDSLRYQITDKGFMVDDPWTRSYLVSGSTTASSPLLYGRIGQVAFADNTAPGAINPIHLFVQPVDVNDVPQELTAIPAFNNHDEPGFNFFMVAGDPFSTQILVYYDPINRLLAAHRVHRDGRLQMLWERDGYVASASPALVPDRDLLYIDGWRDGQDHFVVLRLSTGAELASVPLQAKQPTIGTIFVGTNDDVFIVSSEASGTGGLISRIRCPSAG